MFRTVVAAAAAMAAALTLLTGPVDAQPSRIELGTLTCSMSSSIGLIVGSQKNVNCIFRGRPGEPEEAYTGTMTTIGLDIGITTGGVIVWTVFADTNRFTGMLAGKYAGATAEYRSLRVLAPTCWSAARTGPWRCNHCRCKVRSDSISPPVSASSTCIRPDEFRVTVALRPSSRCGIATLEQASRGRLCPRARIAAP
jgi:Protein of unknown function (DUF992)